MSNLRPLTQEDLKAYYVRGLPLLKLLGYIVLACAVATLAYELLF
jgi:hypothetical protein